MWVGDLIYIQLSIHLSLHKRKRLTPTTFWDLSLALGQVYSPTPPIYRLLKCHSVRQLCELTSRSVMSCHITSHITCHVTSCHVTSCHITQCHVTSCHVTSSHVTSRHVTLNYVTSLMLCPSPLWCKSTHRLSRFDSIIKCHSVRRLCELRRFVIDVHQCYCHASIGLLRGNTTIRSLQWKNNQIFFLKREGKIFIKIQFKW